MDDLGGKPTIFGNTHMAHISQKFNSTKTNAMGFNPTGVQRFFERRPGLTWRPAMMLEVPGSVVSPPRAPWHLGGEKKAMMPLALIHRIHGMNGIFTYMKTIKINQMGKIMDSKSGFSKEDAWMSQDG